MIGKPEKDAAVCNISQNLAIEVEKKKLKRSFEDIVPKAYHHFRSVFAKESFDELPPKRTWDHADALGTGMGLDLCFFLLFYFSAFSLICRDCRAFPPF